MRTGRDARAALAHLRDHLAERHYRAPKRPGEAGAGPRSAKHASPVVGRLDYSTRGPNEWLSLISLHLTVYYNGKVCFSLNVTVRKRAIFSAGNC